MGPQGPEGPQGATGAKGDTGDQGPAGSGPQLLCFATDQTIGTGGKFMGIGQQAGDFDSVSVILPYESGTVTSFIVKGAQGNSPRSGTARLFHEDPNSESPEQLGGDCLLPATPVDTVCFDNAIMGEIGSQGGDDFDSLAVHIETNSGSFEGASACVLISETVPASPPGPIDESRVGSRFD